MVKEKKTRITQQTIIQEYHLTKRIIEKYFPEPIRRKNLDHPGGADLKLWEKETVDRIVRSEEIQVELQKLEKRRSLYGSRSFRHHNQAPRYARCRVYRDQA